MSSHDLAVAIESRFDTFWKPADADVVYNANKYDPTDKSWIRLSMQTGEARRITIHTTFYRTRGIIFAQVFTSPSISPMTGKSLADKVADIYRAQQFDGVNCEAPTVKEIGNSNGWIQTNVLIPFYYDENLTTKTDLELLA